MSVKLTVLCLAAWTSAVAHAKDKGLHDSLMHGTSSSEAGSRILDQTGTPISINSLQQLPVASSKPAGRAPSCGGCARRESVLSKQMRLEVYAKVANNLAEGGDAIVLGLLLTFVCVYLLRRYATRGTLLTLLYTAFYLLASPTAILLNKRLMKDVGFGYPVMVSALGQMMTSLCATVLVRAGFAQVEAGKRISMQTFAILGCASALALVLGQYPYLYLTVAFIQMLKSFSPAVMVVMLILFRIEFPSTRVRLCVLGLSVSACIASAGEVHFHIVGVAFMMSATTSDSLRLVLTQKLLANQKLQPIEALYLTSPMCLLWMLPAAMLTELPTAIRVGSFGLVHEYPITFAASAIAGATVNLTSFLLVKRTSSMTVKALTMARNGGLVLVSAAVMGEEVTALEGFGYTGLMACFTAYTYVKMEEAKKPPPPPPEPSDGSDVERPLTSDSPSSNEQDQGGTDSARACA